MKRNDNQIEAGAAKEAGIPYLLLRVLFSRKLTLATLRYISTVNRYFFIPQFKAKLFPGKIPLVNVDHPMDQSVPFKPETVKVYLSFIKLWIRALSFLRKELGKSSVPYITAFLDELSGLYKGAAYVYNRCLSTTSRPAGVRNIRLAFIRVVDPHFYCVPSLHVVIVCFTFLRIAEILEKEGIREKHEKQIEKIYDNALGITETIIFVRQHSMNCISASLYVLTCLYPDFGREEVKVFIDRLFTDFQR